MCLPQDGFQCPLCKKTYGIKTGDMPNGTMTIDKRSYSLPGYEGHGTYEITYDFKAGNHVSPCVPETWSLVEEGG